MRDRIDKGRVALGRITKPQGLRGELRVKLYNSESDLLWQHGTWLLDNGSEERSVQVRRVRMASQDVAVVAIDGVSDRDAAEVLRGWEVTLPVEALPEPAEDEWYVRDLIGLEVVQGQNDSVGRVVDIFAYPSVDCLVIDAPQGRYEVPMVEPYLLRVELDQGRVVVGELSDFDPIPHPCDEGKAAPKRDRS